MNHNLWPTREWETAHPGDVGIDEARLLDADRHIQAELPNVLSLLVVRNSRLVFERYYNCAATDARNIHSITKSFMSALIGIALDRGELQSLDQKMVDFFPEYAASICDPRINEVTLRHLLTMASGIRSEDSDEAYNLWHNSDDPVRHALSLPLLAASGEKFQYSNMGSHLLSPILSRVSGMTALDYGKRHLFGPAGIDVRQWDADPRGNNWGSTLMTVGPRDLAKFGYLYLRNGCWENRQIVSAEWVRLSATPHMEGCPSTDSISTYGLLWWLDNENNPPTYYACGYGGQYIAIVPDLDLIAVMTANVEGELKDHRHVITGYVLPAAQP